MSGQAVSVVGIEAEKRALRAKAHQRRADLHAAVRAEAAERATQHFFASLDLPRDAVVAGYWPIRDELDIRPILAALMDRGQRVCLPVVVGDDAPLTMREWRDGAPLYEAGFGTLAPAEDAAHLVPDVVLMPLLGFDRLGTRLGYGGGYYDRTLAVLPKRPQLIGFAFKRQEFDHIPRLDHDVPLDAVVTEAGARYFSGDGKPFD